MRESAKEPTALLSAIDLDGPLDAMLLLKRTGAQLAVWTRDPAPLDVLTVMAATLLGSLNMMMEALGEPNPQTAVIDTDVRRMLAARVDSQVALFLIAPRTTSESALREEAQRLLGRIATHRATAKERHVTGGSRTVPAH